MTGTTTRTTQTAVSTIVPDARRKRGSFMHWLAASSITWFAVGTLLLVAVWWVSVIAFNVPAYVLPAPPAIVNEIVLNWQVLGTNTLVTLREILIGYVISVVLGLLVAVLISISPILQRLIYPLLVMTQAIPKIALAPLFLIWMGYGATTNAVIAVLVAFFPIAINGAIGLNSLDSRMVQLGRSMGGRTWQIYLHFRLPNAMPYLFAGFKLGITMAAIGAVVGEFIAGSEGLGYLAQAAAGTLNTPLAIAAVLILSVIGVLLFFVVEWIERLVMPWHASQQTAREV